MSIFDFPVIFFGGILLVVVFIQISNLRSRISKLEGKVLNNQNNNISVAKETAQPSVQINNSQPMASNFVEQNSSPVMPVTTPYETAVKARVNDQTGDDALSRFGGWIKRDWPLKIGAILLIIGFGWLLTYAFQNKWIGPSGQIALGIFLSLIFVSIGYWKMKISTSQGGSFLVVGSTGIIMTIFAAQNVYNMFPSVVALAGIFIASLFVTVASLLYKSKNLAVIGLILSSIAPIMVNSGSHNYIGLYMYLSVVVISSIWIVFVTGWREITLAALVVVSMYSLGLFVSDSMSHYADKNLILIINYLLVGVFYLANLASLVRYKDGNPASDLFSAAINSFYFLVWTLNIVPIDLHVLTIVTGALIFVFGSFFIYIATGRKESFIVYAGAGAMLLGVATTIQLNSQPEVLIIAYTLEIAVMTLVSFILSKSGELAKYIVGLFSIPVVMSLSYMSGYSWTYDYIIKNGLPKAFFVLFLLGTVLFILGLFIWFRNKAAENRPDENLVAGALIIIGSIYAFIIIWLVTHGISNNSDGATFVSMAIYTIVGLATYSIGRLRSSRTLTVYGSTMMIFVTARLLLVDIWHMDSIVSRFVTFFGVGILFMSTTFLAKSKDKLIK